MGREGNRIVKRSGRTRRKKRGWLFRITAGLLKTVIAMILICLLTVAGINLYMIADSSQKLLTEEEAAELADVDYILILGASVYGTRPCPMLCDRLDTGIALYESGVSDMLLMSGDGIGDYYDEVRTMQLYAVDKGVPEEKIELDPQGLCTFDSIKRVMEEYHGSKIVIVTQKYHMYRALYIAKKLGVEAYGVNSDPRSYSGQETREIREIAARCKDFLMIQLKDSSHAMLGKLSRKIEELANRY